VEFAERLGLSPRAYQNYERGERELPSAVLRALLFEFGVDPVWVLVGSGTEHRDGPAASNPDILEAVVRAVETHLQRRRKSLAPEKKARLIKVLYMQFREQSKVNDSQLADVISLIA
jgi:transcriptional regulator with XRE-family HTH domain